MRRVRVIAMFLLAVILTSSCSASKSDNTYLDSTDSTSSTNSESIFERLSNEGTYEWTVDRVNQLFETKLENVYFGGDCAVWVYPSESDVTEANAKGELDFYEGEVWYAGDSFSSKGVALLTDSKDTECAKVVFKVLGWNSEESGDDSSETADADVDVDAASLEGKWGSYSWMDDQVGMFLIIKKRGRDTYQGVFYSQGQSGGVFKDSTIDIVDIGDGLAEVTWPSGNQTTATWGKRSAKTPSNMDPSWKGDIWFDCLDEVDFASSRADCNFYLSK
jgi:hypothetical protein